MCGSLFWSHCLKHVLSMAVNVKNLFIDRLFADIHTNGIVNSNHISLHPEFRIFLHRELSEHVAQVCRQHLFILWEPHIH